MAADAGFDDVRLVTAGPSGVSFSFKPQGLKLDTAHSGRAIVAFSGAQWSTLPNAPALPERSVLIVVPPAGEVTISARPGAWEKLTDRAVATRPAALVTASHAAPAAVPLLRWDGPFWSRNLRLVRIWLCPVQPAAGGLAVTRQVDVDVRFTQTTAAAAPGRTDRLFESIYRNTVLNWEQGRQFAAARARLPVNNPFAGGSEWYKVTVRTDGPSRITQGQLVAAGFPAGTVDPRQIRLFYSGGEQLPVLNEDPRPAFREVAIEVTGESDGSFDAPDEIYFYGQGANRWQNDTGNAVYVINSYSADVVYWLSPGGSFAGSPLRVGAVSGAPGADPAVLQGIGRSVSEQNNLLNLQVEDYYTWYWKFSDELSVVMNLPGATSGIGELALITRIAWSAGSGVVTVNNTPASFVSGSSGRTRYTSTSWLPNTSASFNHVAPGTPWFDRVEATYPMMLNAALVREFWLNASAGNHAQLSGVPAGAMLWDITRVDRPFVVTGSPAGSLLDFDPGASASERRFRLWTRSDARNVVSITRADPGGLRQNPPGSDMLIVHHSTLRAPLESYATFRAAQSGITVELVDVADIYDDFGFGRTDPLAIRDFLKYTYETASIRPSAVLLVGDGVHDFLDHDGLNVPNQIPPYIVPTNLDRTAGDQNFVSFGRLGTIDSDTSRLNSSDRGWDMMIGRWPVRNAIETQIVANKIRNYELTPELGLWKNRVIIVADDEFGNPPSFNEFFHTQQAEGIDGHIPDSFDRRKVYLFEFEKDARGDKPGAREQLVDAWNDGALLLDYVGHGSPNLFAHEDVFRRTRDLPRLFNGGRLPLVYTASCSIGHFDDAISQGMGEELLRRAEGGAVAVISATRVVFSSPNVALNEIVFDFLFSTPSLSMGEALFAGLLVRQYRGQPGPSPVENDRKHVLLGDPFLHLTKPELSILLDTAVVPDTLVALRKTRVAGEVLDSLGLPVSLGGQVRVLVRDALRDRTYQVGSQSVKYTLEGRPIFEGVFPLDSSSFDITFFVPKDISYGEDGARIVAYATGAGKDALGIRAPIPVALLADSTDDTSGPVWVVTINGQQPSATPNVGAADIWKARISDSLGINIGGGGHGITATIDGDEFGKIDITSQFSYDVGSVTAGEVSFSLPDLSAGLHDVRLLAWDNANNPGVFKVTVNAVGKIPYEIEDLLVYPNPFNPVQDVAQLTYELTFPPDRVDLSIYTLAGHKIRSWIDEGAGIGFNFDVSWDGRDDVGDLVATGVYVLAVEAQAAGHNVKDFTKIVLIRSE